MWMAAIPMIGGLLSTVFGGLDELTTSTEEKLALQQKIMATAQPVIAAIIQAQAEFDKASFALRVAEVQSSDRFVRWTRPLMSWMTFGLWAYAFVVQHPAMEYAFYAFGLVAGLFSATRGFEKVVGQWANGKNGGK